MFLAVFKPWMIVLICVAVLLIAALIVVLVMVLKNKKTKIKVDENFINELITNYGGKENIKSVSTEHARLKIEVLDLELVNLEELKQASQAGVFVTGNIIKTLFKFESELIESSLKKLI